MIIDVKIKTLDSQTYEFSVDDGMTLKQFKETIAEKTNVAADAQRMIFCGRVLVDEKQLKDYNVAGKVIHLVERPPPFSPSPTTTSSTSSRPRTESENTGMRGSPMFRALDGMVVGAMTIPLNAGGQNSSAPNMAPLTPSSSFCMNRIIVARHMLQCANNIAAFLENPRRGLHNPPMDILAEGRWTMESTVVEVGISSGNPQDDQEIAEALHGVVSAALRQNSGANVRVVQLPTVFGTNDTTTREAEQQTPTTTESSQNRAPRIHDVDSLEAARRARVRLGNNNQATASTSSEGRPSGEQPSAEPTPSANAEENNATPETRSRNRQRTSCGVLAQVISEMRNVQERLNPFIQQYYDILVNDPVAMQPNFVEETQRVYDRVSEALHYMAHAQHSISDLMLDFSQPPPRFLCCRPILVEQSGYVSTNMASFLQQNGQLEPIPNSHMQFVTPSINPFRRSPAPNPVQITRPQSPGQENLPQPQVAPSAENSSDAGTFMYLNPNARSPQSERTNNPEPDSARNLYQLFDFGPRGTTASERHPTPTNRSVPNRATHQMQVARFIQAVVNSTPMEGDAAGQTNAPTMIRMPADPFSSSQPSQPLQQQPQSTTTTPSETNTASPAANQARVTTATHPTTSTQTRSTARPQVHVSSIQPWNARIIPISNVSSFDRFLPCSSHHIREADLNAENGNQNQANPPTLNTTTPFRQSVRVFGRPYSNTQPGESAPNQDSASRDNTENPMPTTSSVEHPFGRTSFPTPDHWFPTNDATDSTHIEFLHRLRNRLLIQIREVLLSEHTREDGPMIEYAAERLIISLRNILIYLPQYDTDGYDSRNSIEGLLRQGLSSLLKLIFEDDTVEYGNRFFRDVLNLLRRCFTVLRITIGEDNTRIVWKQYTNAILRSDHFFEFLGDDQSAFLKFHRNMMASVGEYDISTSLRSEVWEFIVRHSGVSDSDDDFMGSPTTDSDILPRFELTTIDDAVPMDIEDIMLREGASGAYVPTGLEASDTVIVIPTTEDEETIPTNNVSNDQWHIEFKSEWVPFLNDDTESQKTARAQAPFSNAYISGMSAKRRKTLQIAKPPTDIPALIEASVTQALESNSADIPSNSSNDEEPTTPVIATAMSADIHIRQSLNETLRQRLTERVQNDPDFDKEKFPNSSNYFSK